MSDQDKCKFLSSFFWCLKKKKKAGNNHICRVGFYLCSIYQQQQQQKQWLILFYLYFSLQTFLIRVFLHHIFIFFFITLYDFSHNWCLIYLDTLLIFENPENDIWPSKNFNSKCKKKKEKKKRKKFRRDSTRLSQRVIYNQVFKGFYFLPNP